MIRGNVKLSRTGANILMPRLPYTPEGFGRDMGSALSPPAEIDFSWEELCRSAVTVGRRSWADVVKFGTYSVLEDDLLLCLLANLVAHPRSSRQNAVVAFSRRVGAEKLLGAKRSVSPKPSEIGPASHTQTGVNREYRAVAEDYLGATPCHMTGAAQVPKESTIWLARHT